MLFTVEGKEEFPFKFKYSTTTNVCIIFSFPLFTLEKLLRLLNTKPGHKSKIYYVKFCCILYIGSMFYDKYVLRRVNTQKIVTSDCVFVIFIRRFPH